MNEIIKEQNQKDLKRYRIVIAAVFVLSIIIAMFVGTFTMDNYVRGANSFNSFLNILMPDSIEGNSDEGEAEYTYGMVFYKERNKDYNAKEDDPVQAFNYYFLTEDGKRVDLENGIYYPAAYYDKDMDVQPVQVSLGFYFKALENWNSVKKVIKIVASIILVVLLAFGIYLWYISWRNREIAKRSKL